MSSLSSVSLYSLFAQMEAERDAASGLRRHLLRIVAAGMAAA
jgi:hypothetical protein